MSTMGKIRFRAKLLQYVDESEKHAFNTVYLPRFISLLDYNMNGDNYLNDFITNEDFSVLEVPYY